MIRRVVATTMLLVLILSAFHAPILNGLSSTLVRKDTITIADAIVVLAGDNKGERMMTAIELYKKGFGKKIIFWGGQLYWKFTYAGMFLKQLDESGVPREDILYSDEKLTEISSKGEAKVNIRLLKEAGYKSFILVTSPYHTARAGRVYDSLIADSEIKMYVHPSKNSRVQIKGWWKDRASAKTIYYELNKTIYYYLTD